VYAGKDRCSSDNIKEVVVILESIVKYPSDSHLSISRANSENWGMNLISVSKAVGLVVQDV
jgi:hypothetical protein